MTQPKRKKDEKAELVKLFQSIMPGDFLKVLEHSIQRIIEAELSAILGAEPYSVQGAGRTTVTGIESVKSLSVQAWAPLT